MSLLEFDITGKKVLCVGAGRGIGKGIALTFAEAGADVAITGLTPTGATKVAEEVRKLGRQGLAFSGDATKAAHMDQLAQDVLGQASSDTWTCWSTAWGTPSANRWSPCPAAATPALPRRSDTRSWTST